MNMDLTDPLAVAHHDGSSDTERVRTLRSAIDSKLRDEGIYDHIRALVRAKSRSNKAVDASQIISGDEVAHDDKENLIQQVLESELVQQVVASVRAMDSEQDKTSETAVHDQPAVMLSDDLDNNETGNTLYLRLSGGRAFVDQLIEEGEDGGLPFGVTANHVGQTIPFFRVVVVFQGQRQISSDVPCSVDPKFDEHFRFRITKRSQTTQSRGTIDVKVTTTWESLCEIDEPVQIHLLKVLKKLLWWKSPMDMRWQELTVDLVAVHRLNWRRVLCSGLPMVHFPLQLVGAMKVPVGTLDFRGDILNLKRTAQIGHLATQLLNKRTLEQNARSHAFFKYAKSWWEEYRSETRYDSPALSSSRDETSDEYSRLLEHVSSRPRLIKLFAEDEEGRYRMVCRFLVRLRMPAAVRSPSEAARFVSLLPFESRTLVGGTRDEVWRSIPTFLALKKGDALDHALLLVSLLLGCGLDAYVCIGTVSTAKRESIRRASPRSRSPRQAQLPPASEIGHAWVLTRGSTIDAPSTRKIVFWEPSSGEKIEMEPTARVQIKYCSVDCVFNDSQFFANVQPRKWSLFETSFVFEDETMWKRMDEDLITSLPFAQDPVYLAPPSVGIVAYREQEWTAAIRHEITSRRRSNSLLTRWSDELGFYLLPALNAYEIERLYDVPQIENEFFQQSITRFVPDGHTFQGVPLLFTWESIEDAIASTLQSDTVVQQLVALHARTARFGVAVRCFAYADNTFATWVMLAASYQTT